MYSATVRDERPINDRQYQNSQSVFLLSYLVEHHFNNTISQRDLMHPTSKKFQEIVNFLFRQIDPNFRFAKSVVNDVHTMFKGLRYPVQISKTSLSAVGSAHTWPSLLASLTWLVDLICFDANATAAAEEAATDDVDAIFFEYLCNAYDSFMGNDDEKYAALDEELAATFQARDDEIVAETDEIKAQNDAMRAELAELQAAASSLPALLEKQRCYEEDARKFDDHRVKMQKQQELHEAKLAQHTEKLGKKREQLAATEQRRAALREQLRNQDLSAADVERISQDRARLRESIAGEEEAKEALHTRLWNIEQEGVEALGTLEEDVRKYNELALQLKMVPLGAKNSDGERYELSVCPDVLKECAPGETPGPVLSLDLKHKVKPAVRLVHDKYKAKMHDTRAQAMELEEVAAAGEEAKQERLDEIATLESQASRGEEQVRREREAAEMAVERAHAEVEACDARIHKLRHEETPNMSALRNELREAEAQ